ncbi:MAG: cation-translocating P-type ATPase [Nitrososphaerales archaeon]
MMKSKHENGEFHSLAVETVLEKLSSKPTGISGEDAKNRLALYGTNEIPEKKARHPVVTFLKQFHSILIYVLITAAIIAYLFEHLIDTYVIAAVILINASMGFVQEHRAERSIRALKKMIVASAKVIREGELLQIPARELVPGDIILLEEGDRVPADARLFQIKRLMTVEASLTGESLPVDKHTRVLPEKTALADRRNMIWMGTFVTTGQARAVVTATGIDTAIGKIAQEIEKIKKVKGHFEKKTDELAKLMGIIATAGASTVFLIGFFVRSFDFAEIFLFTIASLVSGIPEGLPAVLIIVLAIGAHRVARRNAIIRTLPATETLGVITVIVTDKTGTLTENTMNIEKIILPNGEEITVSGAGWKPSGNFYQEEKAIIPLEDPHLSKLLQIAAVCNSARLLKKEDGEDRYEIMGDPTEAALVVLAEKAGLKKEVVQQRGVDDLPFNPELKYRASLSQEDKIKEIFTVGAPETVLDHSAYVLKENKHDKMTKHQREEILSQIEYLTNQAMRVLALAYKEVSVDVDSISEDLVNELVFVGIVGMIDPPRPEVKRAVSRARKAGIKVIMATGDHKSTALAIAKEIGLLEESAKGKGRYPEALTEGNLMELSEKEFESAVGSVTVFARLTPTMKLRIAETLQKQGHVVAMTGDGVNDAPALKKADIGIAMGVIGTDMARESSEVVLADDNFASIVNAVEEGRIVFVNTRQASAFLVTTNFAEHMTIVSTLLLGLPLPLLPTQILWLNLVTDGVSDVALATEPGHGDVLEQPPRKKEENILSREIVPFLILMTVTMAVEAVIVFNTFLPEGIDKARTGAFALMAFCQLFNVLNMRSLKNSVFKIGLFTNKYILVSLSVSVILLAMVIYTPFFQGIFRFDPLNLIEILAIVLLSSLVLWFGELYKLLKK